MVSVLINNYNNGPFLKECIDSVLQQSRKADEIIVYDDGSTDESATILRSFGQQITVIWGEHDHTPTRRENQTHAVERAFQHSSGQHVYLLDGDDYFLPAKIESYEQAWSAAPDAILLHSPSRMVDDSGQFIRDNNWAYKRAANYHARTYELNDTDLYYSTSTLALDRGYLERRIPFEIDDLDLAVDERLSSLAPLFGQALFVPGYWTAWRQHPNSGRKNSQQTILREIIRRNRFFNRWALRKGARPLLLWHNILLLRQLVRLMLPRYLVNLYLSKRGNVQARP